MSAICSADLSDIASDLESALRTLDGLIGAVEELSCGVDHHPARLIAIAAIIGPMAREMGEAAAACNWLLCASPRQAWERSMNAIVKVDFHGDTVTAVRDGDAILVAVKPIIERLGLDWEAQRQRIKRDDILSEGACIIQVPSPGGVQDTTCLPLNMLPGFLFGIDTSRIPDPDVRATALCYKRECHAVLFRHFFGPKDDPPEETDRDTLDQNLRYVKEVRITCGPKAARQLMAMLGLFTGDPESETKASKQSESLLPYIADFLEECTEPDSAGHVRPDELYRLYLRWATRNKAPHFTMTMFGRMLRGAGLQKRKSGTSIYMGIRIRFDIRKELGL